MGRRRIEIKKIIDQRARRATFGKRKSGLFKKAWEFGVLTGSKVYVVIEDERKTQYSFTTNKEDLYLKYHDIDPENRVAPQDFGESAESPETLSSATGAIVGATRQQPQTQMSNNNDIEELPDAFSSDSLVMDVMKPYTPLADTFAPENLPSSCFSPRDIQCYLPTSASFIDPNMLSIGGDALDTDQVDIFSLNVPGLFSPVISGLGFQPLSESIFSQDYSTSLGYIEGLPSLAMSPRSIPPRNWLM